MAGLTNAACFQFVTLLSVKPDASGTLNVRTVFSPAALEQVRKLSALGAGAADPLSEQQARELATQIGTGVVYVSSTPIKGPEGEGREALYSFTNINDVRVTQQATPPIGGLASSSSQVITFSLDQPTGGGNAVLRIRMPTGTLPTQMLPVGPAGTAPTALEIAGLRQMVGGARITIAVEPAGTLVRTSSPYQDANRVTLFDVDADQLLTVEALGKLRELKGPADLKSANLPGLKIVVDPEVTIEFAP